MFGAVISYEENCRHLLELVLGVSIARVEIDKEKSLINHPEYKGVRLDVFAEDENKIKYNIEMQAVEPIAIAKKDSHYHSQIDIDLLAGGVDYNELPYTYVFFV